MKTRYGINTLRLLVAAALVTVAGACTGNFEEYNHNPNETTDSELERDNYNVGAKLLQLQNEVIPSQEHLYQFTEILAGMAYGGYSEAIPTWTGKFSTFNPTADWLKAPFVTLMTDTYAPYRGILAATEDEVPLALASLLRVAIMHRLTDQYGPIPYSKVVEDRKNSLAVAYDTQEEVYATMFAELDAAVSVLNENRTLSTEAFGEYDLVYGGDLTKWILFANSLKLRMAMRLTEVDAAMARTKAAEALAAGVITTNADNAMFKPTVNRTAICFSEWKQHPISADLDSYMNGYADPRRGKMFTSVKITETTLNPETQEPVTVTKDGYRGQRIGTTPEDKDAATTQLSHPDIVDSDPIIWLTAAEVAFLKAEWELRWGSVAEAGNLYRQGVALSFEQWGAGSADEYLATEARPADFVDPLGTGYDFSAQSTITPVWNDADDAATALERIITQKWIAIFPLGNEAWSEYRRTGYPHLMPVPDAGNMSGGTVTSRWGARRLQYPTEEYNENRANVTAAVAGELKGTDTFGSRVWWDKRTLN
ncbi:SusD/RagB family nutrient-binding outer membrane lipoprotein [Alistipes sp.]|uniref:SusD/RagB family nutrient-binding outer membrane lipoprotein n=1 Tax=Alistipes sp. TaxID=1872444 RepID=UPI003A85995C